MNKHVSLTKIELDPDTASLLREEAAKREIDRSELAAYAIRSWLEGEAADLTAMENDPALEALIREADDDIAAGRVVSHEDVMAELDEMIERHRRRA